jgi:hypothetical protein
MRNHMPHIPGYAIRAPSAMLALLLAVLTLSA